MKAVQIKVCGLKEAENIAAISNLNVDFLGFIFYSKSPRLVNGLAEHELPKAVTRVGVFVDETFDLIKEKITTFKLNMVQLHGDESPEFCHRIQKLQVKVMKAFSVDEQFDFAQTKFYETSCDLFLFDTKGANRGGNGITFDWKLLQNYSGTLPFMLSGGIGPEMAAQLRKFKHPKLQAIDLNSRFEDEPGLKNIQLLKSFISKL